MLTSCYVDAPTFVRGAMGVETASLLGGNSALAAAASVGATSLTVSDGTGFALGPGWICDGPNTEVVMITVVSGATLTVSAPLLAAHVAGVNVATGGTAGALGRSSCAPPVGRKAFAGMVGPVTPATRCCLP